MLKAWRNIHGKLVVWAETFPDNSCYGCIPRPGDEAVYFYGDTMEQVVSQLLGWFAGYYRTIEVN